MDDPDAIRACQQGRAEAFRHLVERYQGQAMGHAMTMLVNREDALDAVQEALVDAYRGIRRFDPTRRFYPWLYAILRNRCRKQLQKRKRLPATLAEDITLVAAKSKSQGGADTEALQHALLGLAAEDRELITLKHLDGLSYAQLAEHLSIPAGTVMSRLHAARQKLRAKLAGHPSFKAAMEEQA
ncbi:MAG: RNA polymerase sigma factor [Planctomycetota bacterium]|jgi:RNA polymerase sigma-70 factor (ECF subfamily)